MVTIHLIGIGTVPAKPYGEVVVGDRLVYNYGITNTVVAVERVTDKTVAITEVDAKGATYTFKRRATTLIGVAR